MKRAIAVSAVAALFAIASAANANTIVNYGWEDGSGTILGSFGNLASPANVTTGDEVSDSVTIYTGVTPNNGTQMLTVSESPHASTPQAYIGYIEGLSPGDTITASFYGWDSTSGASPSLRIWGHWANNGDVNSYVTSAGGNSAYTDTGGAAGWSNVGYTWTNDDGGGGGYDALVIEARLYSTPATADPATTSYFIDDLSIEVNSSSGSYKITTPGGTVVVPEPATIALLLGSLGLAFVRRRRD